MMNIQESCCLVCNIANYKAFCMETETATNKPNWNFLCGTKVEIIWVFFCTLVEMKMTFFNYIEISSEVKL